MRIAIPDDSPAVLAPSKAFPALKELAPLDYYETLPAGEEGLVERIGNAAAVLNIRASTKFTARVFQACPKLRMLSIWGTGTDHVDLAAYPHAGLLRGPLR